MPFVEVDQLSVDWLHMRSGCATSSHLGEIMSKRKPTKEQIAKGIEPEELAVRLNYKKKKVWELLTGLSADSYVSSYMEAGLDNEPLAREAYSLANDVEVLPGGLFVHDEISRFMASPDGRIGEDGLLEMKYLQGFTTEANHLDLLMGAPIPDEYVWQMTGQLACSGRKWVDFCSYDRRFPKPMRLFTRRVTRDEAKIKAVEEAVEKFLLEVAEMFKSLQAYAAQKDDLTQILKDSLEATYEPTL